MGEISEEVKQELNKLKDQFWVGIPTLNKIIEYFIKELDRGNCDGTDPLGIPMCVTWVLDYPDGSETGDYLALDFGGTNLRVVMVHLLGDGKLKTEQEFYKLPDDIRITKNKDELFDFMANCLGSFIKNYKGTVPETHVFPLGFTFSYPATQNRIDSGILQRWTKGFNIPDVEGHDVVPMLMEKIEKKKLPIKIVALINDTCGTLTASRYVDQKTEMGCIFGTGFNGSYYERVKNIKKLEGKLPSDIHPSDPMLVNCEYGSFDNAHKVLPRTKFDIFIDENSPRPGQQAYEKMTAGYYLGEIFRLVILDESENGILFKNISSKFEQQLKKHHFVDASFLSNLELDETDDLSESKILLEKELFYDDASFEECYFAKTVASFIGTRSARIAITGISAVCKKMNYNDCHIAVDGSVYMKYPHYPERAAQGLADVFGWTDIDQANHPIKIVKAHDGSGVGAAVIAALAHKRIENGLSVGFLDTVN